MHHPIPSPPLPSPPHYSTKRARSDQTKSPAKHLPDDTQKKYDTPSFLPPLSYLIWPSHPSISSHLKNITHSLTHYNTPISYFVFPVYIHIYIHCIFIYLCGLSRGTYLPSYLLVYLLIYYELLVPEFGDMER